MDDLTGKVAVITGGARGVGLGLAKAFAGQGMRLVLSDINTTTLDEAVATLRASGAEAIGVTADVSDTAAVNHLRDEAFARFGAVHVLCNNATGGGGGPFCEPIDVSVWETAMSATVYSVLRGLNAFLPRMLDQGDGHIVNTASRQGLVPSPILGSYPPAKSAVIALSEMLHAELAERGSPVGVTVLTPGGVKTEGILASLALHESGQRDDPAMREFLASRVAAAVDPVDLGRLVVRAIREGALYVNTHGETLKWLQERVDRMVADSEKIGYLVGTDTTSDHNGAAGIP
jgi:NAD(P)-dependent dehydrogenase (short-subunit alcohol dehydrogenase family)